MQERTQQKTNWLVLVPLFWAHSGLLYLELMDRFPNAQQELRTIFANLFCNQKQRLPLYIQITTQTFNELNVLNMYECNRAVCEAFSKAIKEVDGCEPLPL